MWELLKHLPWWFWASHLLIVPIYIILGTAKHELAHVITAKIKGFTVKTFKVIPSYYNDRFYMGYYMLDLQAVRTQGKKGWSHHPETQRWRGKLAALYARHEQQIAEMDIRGWNHKSPLDQTLATGSFTQDVKLFSIETELDHMQIKKGQGKCSKLACIDKWENRGL